MLIRMQTTYLRFISEQYGESIWSKRIEKEGRLYFLLLLSLLLWNEDETHRDRAVSSANRCAITRE